MMAKYAWIVPTTTTTSKTKTNSKVQQYLWSQNNNNNNLIEVSHQTISPYHRPNDEESQDLLSLVPINSIKSILDNDGGMHRLFHHTIPRLPKIKKYYIFVIVPQGMFIDLDDPIEVAGRRISIYLEY